MNKPFFSASTYTALFSLLGVVYIIGLFVPLMNNDSGHHAMIALHMHQTGDYASLIDREEAYLDKPHLLFWLAAFSFKIFGINAFAYKFPSFLFTLLGTYSTYRLGHSLYNKETGKLAALIVASAFAYILANNDVRMDAILAASIVFATWQLVEFIQHKRMINVAGAALGLALGFATKGHIAVFSAAVAAFFYIVYRKEWKIFLNPKWILLVVLFGLFISPVVYSYYLQFNLHPETTVRGKNNVDGVSFILWGQSIERFSGEMGKEGKNDYLFFIHSFLWAFAPWSILAFISYFNRIKTFFQRKEEWLTTGLFTVMLVVISFSQFKLPHYLNIVFPTAAVMTSAYFLNRGRAKTLYTIQLFVSILILIAAIVLNTWVFPVDSAWVIIGAIAFLLPIVFAVLSKQFSLLQKAVLIPVLTTVLVFFLLNTNFYPKLLTYQGGNEMARQYADKVDVNNVYYWDFTDEYAWYFHTNTLPKRFDSSVLSSNKKIWMLADSSMIKDIKAAGYVVGQQYAVPDYRITRLKMNFINPATRNSATSQLVLSEVFRNED